VPAAPARARVVAARRRRAARRLGAVGALGAAVAALALNLGPGGGPDDRGILARAASAATQPPGSIVVLDTELRTRGRFKPSPHAAHQQTVVTRQRSRTWIETSRDGRIVRFRQLITDSDGDEAPPVGLEETAPSQRPGLPRTYDPRTRRTTVLRRPATEEPSSSFALRVPKTLADASRDPRARLTHRDGRLVYRTSLTQHSRLGEVRIFRVLLLDPETYRPYLSRVVERSREDGKPAYFARTERILARRTLPDTPANRRFLALRGPTR
jgi:hypothetical protein